MLFRGGVARAFAYVFPVTILAGRRTEIVNRNTVPAI
jgi:hypothetical protein